LLGDNDWLINSLPRLNANPDCQIIQVSPVACDTCPLADRGPEDPPSPFLQHVVYLSSLQEAGAQFGFNELTSAEWEGLRMLKRKRDEKQIRDMKTK